MLSWGPGAGSAFFELTDGTRIILSAPRRSSGPTEWLGLELHTDDPNANETVCVRWAVPTVSEVYDTDGGSRACVVDHPTIRSSGWERGWPLPTTDADLSKTPPRERTLPLGGRRLR